MEISEDANTRCFFEKTMSVLRRRRVNLLAFLAVDQPRSQTRKPNSQSRTRSPICGRPAILVAVVVVAAAAVVVVVVFLVANVCWLMLLAGWSGVAGRGRKEERTGTGTEVWC